MTDLAVSATETNLDTINAIKLSETSYFQIDELIERMDSGELNYCPEKIYIREGIQHNNKKYREALTTFDLDTGEVLYLIIFPITIFKKDGKEYLINGNSRVANLMSMYKDASPEDKKRFLPVAYNYLLNEPTDELLLAFQRYSNDTTIAHSIIEKLIKAESFHKQQLTKFKKEGLTDMEAKGKASLATRRALGDIKQSQLSKIMNVSNFCKENGTLRGFIENEQIGIDCASQIITLFKKLTKKKDNADLSLDFLLVSIKAIADADGNKNDKGLTLIEPRYVEAYEKSLIKVEVKKVEPTLQELIDSCSLTADAVDDIQAALEEHKEKLTEGQLIAEIKRQLNDEDSVCDATGVKQALVRLKIVKPVGENVTVDQLISSKNQLVDSIGSLNIERVKDTPETSKPVSEFTSSAFKFLTKTNRYFKGTDSMVILNDLLQIITERVLAINAAIGEDNQSYPDIKKLIDDMNDEVGTIQTYLTANSGAKSQAVEADEDDEDSENDDSDVYDETEE
jgi:hypothetical protein